MLAELDELGVEASDVAELGRAELGEVCLGDTLALGGMTLAASHDKLPTYVNIKSEDWVLLARALEAGDLRLELVLRLLPLRTSSMVALRLLLAVRRWLLLMVRGSLVVLFRALGRRLRIVPVLRRRVWAVLRLVVAHVAIV
jgi:hypothetical protein